MVKEIGVLSTITIFSLVATACLASGPSQYVRQRTLAICSGGFVFVAVFVVMMFEYHEYASGGPSLLGPFTTPTTWMVLGLWGVPTVFVFIYCLTFDTWFGSDETIQDHGESN